MLESSHQFDPATVRSTTMRKMPGQSYSVRPKKGRTPPPERRTETSFTPGRGPAETHPASAGSEPEFAIGQSSSAHQIDGADGEAESILGHDMTDTPFVSAGDGTEFSEGHRDGDYLSIHALAEPVPDVGLPHRATHSSAADIGETLALIVENWRARQDFLRARMRLELQAQAVCRRYCDGDKAEAAKLWAKVKKDRDHELLVWLEPYILAMAPLDAAEHKVKLKLEKLARKMPVHDWAKSVLGLGDLLLAGVLGECAIGPGEYRTVSALWKRMELAVIDGKRQRRVSGEDALRHNYGGQRRSLMWVIGGSLIKSQVRNQKDENGKKIEGTDYAIGEYGQLYLDRKQYLRERDAHLETPPSPMKIHNDAKRYIEKRLLRELWKAWRRASLPTKTITALPASN